MSKNSLPEGLPLYNQAQLREDDNADQSVRNDHLKLGSFETRITHDLLRRLAAGITLVAGPHEQFEVLAPYTGEAYSRIPMGRDADVELAVQRARSAQPSWAARSPADRAKIFLRFHDLLFKKQEETLDLIQLETGKARLHAFEEVLDTAIVSRYYALRAEEILRPRRRKGALPGLTRTTEFHVPLGVVGFIVPWNSPLNLAVTDAAPALLAGNTAVLRPDPQTSFIALWALDLLRQAGLPPDVLTIVTGEGPVIGPPLIDNVDFLMFTGSTGTGKHVARSAAARLIGYSLELGGKNPMIILPDADLESAVDGAIRGCYVGAGQICISTERIYIHRSIFDRFVAAFVERSQSLKVGVSLDYSVQMGSLTSRRQLDRVEEHVEDAVSRGATLLCGGRPRPDLGPLFYSPTVLTDVREGMKLFLEETFGPVVSVSAFDNEEEVIERANESRYGLNASVWTEDIERGVRFARRLRAGSVNVNEAYAATWGSVDSPIGGMKESGVGRRHGAEGILKFTDTQTVAVQRLHPIAPSQMVKANLYTKSMSQLVKYLRRVPVLR